MMAVSSDSLSETYLQKDSFWGIYDFSYAPYALGDALTWQVNSLVKAIESKRENIEIFLIADPSQPSSFFQTHIHEKNYFSYLSNLFPAFLCCPKMSSVHVVTDKRAFNLRAFRQLIRKQPAWPSLVNHFLGRLEIASHKEINAFFKKNGYIPKLKSPRGYENSVDEFLRERCGGAFLVSVNIRQRRLYPDLLQENKRIVDRDSPHEEWSAFFTHVQKQYPKVLFLILGGYSTWERDFFSLKNVLIPRTMGMDLAHELTLLHKSDLFMGTSSGFSAMATFSDIPYIITNFDHNSSKYIELPIGTERYPFAAPNQILNWERESAELLFSLFETSLRSLGGL